MGVYNYYEFYMQKMLSEISEKYEKTPGGPVYDICSGCAMIAAELADTIQANMDMLDPKNRTGADLDSYIFDHSGLERKDGVYAQVTLKITGTCTVYPDYYFSTSSGVAFHPVGKYSIVTSGLVECECVLQGTIGNVPAGTITKSNQSIAGLVSVTNPEPAFSGVTKESDEDFLWRFYEYIRKPQGSGTVADIKQEVESIDGVGSCKVTPDREHALATIVITASDGGLPSASLVAQVQEYVDPRGENDTTWGCGYGVAPIGLRLDVVMPAEKQVKPKIWLTDGTVVDETAVNRYFEDNLYKSAEWRDCFDGGIADYLSIYNACQNAMNSYAEKEGLAAASVNIRNFAMFIDNAERKMDYDIGDAVASGGQITIRSV